MTAERRALVVDDDAGIRILLSRILTRHGFVVDAVRDGAEAIEDLLQHDYALITLDLMMPRIDGFTVVKYISEHLPHKLDSVIVMTASCVSKPLIVFFAPVFLTLKSTSISFAFGSFAAGAFS